MINDKTNFKFAFSCFSNEKDKLNFNENAWKYGNNNNYENSKVTEQIKDKENNNSSDDISKKYQESHNFSKSESNQQNANGQYLPQPYALCYYLPYPPYNDNCQNNQQNPNAQFQVPPPYFLTLYYYNKPPKDVGKKMRKVCIGTISIFVFWVIFLISLIVSISIANQFPPYLDNYKEAMIAFIFFATLFAATWLLGYLSCGIVGTIRAIFLSKIDRQFNTVMILYIVGFFIPFIQFITAIFVIVTFKKQPHLLNI